MVQIHRVETKEQILLVEELGKEIWHAHYTPIIGKDQVIYMLEKFQSLKAIQEQMTQGFEYYLINDGIEPSGYFAVQKREAELFLSKLYVHHEKRGLGLGGRGLEYIEARAQQLNCDQIGLTVNKYNQLAISTYEKKGFFKERELVIDIGSGFIMDDYKMIKKLGS